ncbi:MAG: zinc ribbon domain-containing protein [Ruminococcaceae bacterium]|nr:zinc ribbon domain-containing protein [Oscillospiraceae bacterium]
MNIFLIIIGWIGSAAGTLGSILGYITYSEGKADIRHIRSMGETKWNYTNTSAWGGDYDIRLSRAIESAEVGEIIMIVGIIVLLVSICLLILGYILRSKSKKSLTNNQIHSTVKFCTNCGTRYLVNQKFCNKCGAVLSGNPQQSQNYQQ